MPLTDAQVKNAKAEDCTLKLFDGAGMYLLLQPGKAKCWRLKYRFGGKEKLLSLGVYPEVGLKEARERRDQFRRLLRDGVDPSVHRKAVAASHLDSGDPAFAFETIAREWLATKSGGWVEDTREKKLSRLERHVFPVIGKSGIQELKATDLLPIIRKAETKGAHELARRLRQMMSHVFQYAIATGRAERDWAADIRGALAAREVTHRPALTDPRDIGGLVRAIETFTGEATTKAALKLAALTFVRPGELRAAEWSEFDLEDGLWRIPAARMKTREPHLVPLSRQAIDILREQYLLTGREGRGKFVFPSIRSWARCMSENTLNAALRRLGYTQEQMTAHGFRAMASTRLHESGEWNSEVIERQLAHRERNKVKAAYNRAEHIAERKRMMQWWADHLDKLSRGAEIVALRSAN